MLTPRRLVTAAGCKGGLVMTRSVSTILFGEMLSRRPRPESLTNIGRVSLKKPCKQEGGAKRICVPCALEAETKACAVSPVNMVCLGTKMTECLTFALAEEMEVPANKYLLNSCGWLQRRF